MSKSHAETHRNCLGVEPYVERIHVSEAPTFTGKSYRLGNEIESAAIESDAESKLANTHAGKTARTRSARLLRL
jgi:hypothetical protein